MTKSGNSLREAMSMLTREERAGAEHPSTNRLIAYYRGEIPLAQVAAIREHLSLCGECAALVLDAAEFFADDDEEEAPPADLEASWRESKRHSRTRRRTTAGGVLEEHAEAAAPGGAEQD